MDSPQQTDQPVQSRSPTPDSPQTPPPSLSQTAPGTTPPAGPVGTHPDFVNPPAKPGETRVQPIWVSPDDWHSTQTELRTLREFRQEQERREEQAEAERIKLLTDKGQIEEAYKSLKDRYGKQLTEATTRQQTVERKWLDERRNAVINEVLTGRTFAGVDPQATAAMVRRLLGEEIEAILGPEGDPIIRDRKTLRPAADYLRERLESPDMALFFGATHRGGAGTDGARPAAATPRNGADPFAAFANDFRDRREAALQGRNLPNSY